uniref:Putative transcription factor ap-1 n=1 Tax=Rhipicephalus microplus TaxID=6941 RepID=A0A6M2D3M0_RHIMP
MPLLTTSEFEELLLDFSAPEMTPPMPTTVFQLSEEEKKWCNRLIDGLPEPNVPRQQRTQRQPHPVLQQHVTVGANESDSSSPVSNCTFSLPSSPELLVVKDNAQTVPTLGVAPPSWYMHSDENRTRESSAEQMTMHTALHQQPRGEEFGSSEWIATLNLDDAGRYRNISVQAHCSSLQAFTDLKMLQMTSPERKEIKKGFYVPELPPKPSTRLSCTGQVQQYLRCCIDVLPGLQRQQQQRIREQPSAVFQQLVTEGPNVSDSSASTSNPSSNGPTWSEHSAMGDHVKNSQTVPTLGNSSPLCYTVSEMLH